MRVLMLNNEYPPIGGGTATANFYVIREMIKQGISVDLVTSTPLQNEYEIEVLNSNSRIYRIPINNKNPHYQTERELITYIVRGFFFIRTLYRGSEEKYDLCHAWSGVPAGALALLLKWKRYLPYVLGLRGSDVPGYDIRYRWLYPFLSPSLHQIWQNALAITANSYELRSLALKFRPAEQIEVIPNGIDLQRFKPTQLADKGANDLFRILCVARLVDRKGIQDLIQAADLIRQQRQNFKFTFVGRGEKESEFRGLVAEKGLDEWIKFAGAVLHNEMPAVYNQADVFVLPSLNEGMSNAILEAMASALPIITTYTGGTAEMLRGNGILIPKQAPDALAAAIIELWDNYDLRCNMGRRSRSIAETMLWPRVAAAYLSMYERALSKKSSQRKPYVKVAD